MQTVAFVQRHELQLTCLIPLLTVASLLTATVQAETDATPPRPNILLILADDLGYEALGCYGGLDFQTPRLDRFASRGLRFTRAYTSPVCTPSRMSLYTGTYASRHGYVNVLPVHKGTTKAVDFRTRHRTFAQRLRDAGYQTSVTGKWQLATLEHHPKHCRDAGFDSWCVWQIWKDGAKTTRYWEPCLNHDGVVRDDIAERFGPNVLSEYVIDQMKQAIKANQPFYVHHNMMLPHWPITAMPAERADGNPGTLAGMIQEMDRQCGELFDAVERLGIAGNTWVIFMGDNGTEAFGKPRRTKEGVVEGGKTDLTDAGTHIPLLVRRPGFTQPGSVTNDLVDMADWYPTICELTGTEVPETSPIDGISIAGRLNGNEASHRKFVTAGYGGKISVFDGTHRLTDGDAWDDEDPHMASLADVLERLRSSAPNAD